jgi:DNA-binding beta-propeller fold protein YncE
VSAIGPSRHSKPEAPGEQLWVARYSGPTATNSYDRGNAVAVSPDGSRVFVTGESTGPDGVRVDYATQAYVAATGAVLWTRRFAGPGDNTDKALAVAVSPDGTRVFVTGFGWYATEDYITFAYDAATGATVWASRFDSPYGDYDEASALAVSADGSRVFVTGDSGGSTTYSDLCTVAYDALTGAQLWVGRE